MKLYGTVFWWSCTIHRGVAHQEHWNQVQAEVIDLEILCSEAKRERVHLRRERKEEKRRLRGGLDRTSGRNEGGERWDDIAEATGRTFQVRRMVNSIKACGQRGRGLNCFDN